MHEARRVVVGIDGSQGARTALRWALHEAELQDSVLQVLHAWREPKIFVPDEYPGELVEMGRMDEAAQTLIDRELAAVGVESFDVSVDHVPVGGGTARALVEASRAADLVVVGRRGTGGLVQELVGPKVVQVAHHAACPVAAVPGEWGGEGEGVVVGLDGSEHSKNALGWAAAEAARRDTTLTAVLAWDLLSQQHADGSKKFDPDYTSADALAALEEMVAAGLATDVARQPGAGEVSKEVVNDLPARALLSAAEGAEVLVVGARGLGGFKGLLLGSVSHRCLVHSTCPTVVVRSGHGRVILG